MATTLTLTADSAGTSLVRALDRLDAGTERLVLIAWVAAVATVPYFLINLINAGTVAASLATPIDRLIPLQAGWQFVYTSFYLVIFVPFLVVKDRALLRRIVVAYTAVYVTAYVLYVLYPVQVFRDVDPNNGSFAEWGMRLNRALDAPYNCFPSLHVAISITAAWATWRADRVVGTFVAALAIAIVASTLFLKQHYLLDVVGGLVLAAAVGRWLLTASPRQHGLAYPRARAALFPAAYAVTITLAFAAFHAGIQPPATGWQPFTRSPVLVSLGGPR